MWLFSFGGALSASRARLTPISCSVFIGAMERTALTAPSAIAGASARSIYRGHARRGIDSTIPRSDVVGRRDPDRQCLDRERQDRPGQERGAADPRRCASPISRPDTIRLTAGWQLASLRAMRRIVQTIAAIRFALSTRRDLLLEVLALRHQLGVLARSNRRFRSANRLLWLILRRVWPRWRDAPMLVQPATVDRWYRDGLSRWWPRRTRRPATNLA